MEDSLNLLVRRNNKMKKLALSLLLIFFSAVLCFGQQRKIVLRIDTIDFLNKLENFSDFKIIVTNQGLANLGDWIEPDSLHFHKFPQFYCSLNLQSDSSKIRIPFDNKEGYLEIESAYSSNLDTIQISHYVLYSNCNIDSVKIWKTYFYDDTLLVNKRKSFYKEKELNLQCERKPPDKVTLKINGKAETILVNNQIEKSGSVTSGHGSKRSIFGKQKNRFHITKTHSYPVNILKLKLSPL